MTVAINTIKISDTNLTITYTGGDPDPPKPSGYNCNNNNCEESKSGSGTFNTIDECNSKCVKIPTDNCSTSPQIQPSFPKGSFTDDINKHYPSSSDLNTSWEDRLKTTYIKETPENIGVDINKQIDTIELAKIWIVSTHGLTKKWNNGETVEGGFPTCSRAISTATAESGGNAPKTNSYDAGYYGTKGGCGDPAGGCWQTSNPQTEICNYTANPFCSALQAWGHKTGKGGISSTSCDDSNGNEASSCTVEKLTKTGINPGCHFGAICYGSSSSGWNSPPRAAMFRLCSEGTSSIPFSKTLPGACNPYTDVKTSCEIAECSCKIALQELKEQYKDISFKEVAEDNGYTEFKTACNNGRTYNPS